MNRNVPWGVLNVSKLILTGALILLTVVDLCMAASHNSSGNIYPVDFYTPVIKIVTFVSIVDRWRGIPVSLFIEFQFSFLRLLLAFYFTLTKRMAYVHRVCCFCFGFSSSSLAYRNVGQKYDDMQTE